MDELQEGSDVLTERDKAVARAVGEMVAQILMARLLAAVQDETVQDKVVGSWSARVDRIIGRSLRRFGFFVFVALMGVGAAKLGLWEKFWGFFK